MARYKFDLIVIGGGGAGITSALLASGLGKRVALVDKKKFGGECTWTGCVPSKAIIQSARISHYIATAARYGLDVKGKFSIGHDRVMENVRKIVNRVYKGESGKHFAKLGIDAVENADISFTDPHTLSVNGTMMTSDKFMIATGSSPLVPGITGMDRAQILTNEKIFSLKKLPASMAILGGGPVGAEMAMALNRLGVRVTLVEQAPVILPREDREISEMLEQCMKREGIEVLTGSTAARVSGTKKITLFYEIKGYERSIAAESVLVAVGRRPNTDGLNLDAAGVSHDPSGIKVDKYLRTSAKNIYAAGDVTGAYQFSHVANYQAIIATSNALLPVKRKVSYENVPWCIFTDPELARSGLTESEALERYGSRIRVYRVPYDGIDRAVTDRAEAGLAKFICDRRGMILGIHILGERAGELLHEVHSAKTLGLPLYRLNSVIHAYPTYNDIVRKAGREAYVDKLQRNVIVKLVKLFRNIK
jgi:pyruvate/2-oxoglutarate dehydrogenase complex dihydrolipoamide dehydrogenase (E3) component